MYRRESTVAARLGGHRAGVWSFGHGNSRRLAFGLAAAVPLLLAWYVLTSVTHTIGPGRFPSPQDVFRAALQISRGHGYAGGTMARQVWQSSKLVLMGFAVAAGAGVPLGLLMGWSRRAEALINPAFLMLRPIPPLAWIPLAILWFGLGDFAKIFVIWFAAFVPAAINSHTGVRNVDPTLIAAARVHGASPAQVVLHVLVPGALPMIFTGLRLSLQASWTTLVAAELVGALLGLGHVLVVASLDIYPGMILYAMIWVGIMGALMTKALALIEKRAIPWRS
ncbi:MAG TPA: ABC transporter permease [Burkholderiales bacterium]|nr:ABC transporter permease [Burkholderiales bacterium]